MRPTAPCGTHAPTSLRRPAWSKSLVSSRSILFLSTKSSLVSLHLHDATETLSVDRGGVRVNCKLGLLIVQLRQDAKFNPAPRPRHVQHAKSVFGGPNARRPRLGPLKSDSPDAKAKPARLVKCKRHAPLGVGLSSPLTLKRLCPDAPSSNATVASRLNRDARHTS